MNKKNLVILAVIGLMFSFMSISQAQQPGEQFKLLVVDETESIESSMRVQGFVGALKQRPEVEIITRMFKPDEPTDNPIEKTENLEVDAVLIFPHTIDTGMVNQVWIVTRPYSAIPVEARKETANMMEQLKDGIEQAFSGKVNAVGVDDDVIPAYFSTLFLREGVLR